MTRIGNEFGNRLADASLQDRMAAYRQILEGHCFFMGDRWFPQNTPEEESSSYLRLWERQREKNRKLRERRQHEREAIARERRIAALPPSVQSSCYGRTADVMKVHGIWKHVDYRKTYGRPFGEPSIPGVRPMEVVLEAVSSSVENVAQSLTKTICGHCRSAMRGNRGRLQVERRKIRLRSTIAHQPTPTDIRVAWHFRREYMEGYLRIGALLLDLECFVDNALVFDRTCPKPKIAMRRGGIRRWIGENCPELVGHYKTLMRYKALARRFSQVVDIWDPLPVSAVLDGVSAEDLCLRIEHVQPSRGEESVVTERFPWELAQVQEDWQGRRFKSNVLYKSRLSCDRSKEHVVCALEHSRKILRMLYQESSGGTEICLSQSGHVFARKLDQRISDALAEREQWWERQ